MKTESLNFDGLPKAVAVLLEKVNRLETLLIQRQEQTTPTEPKEKLLNVQEAAKFLNLAVPTIYSKVSRGELPVMKRSKRLYFSDLELMEYLKEGRQKTNDEIADEVDNHLSKMGKE